MCIRDRARPEPVPTVIVEDTTTEALRDTLRDNERGVIAVYEELDSWIGSHDAYRAGSSKDRGEWLRLESTTAGALQWLAGLYYFNEQLKIDSFNYSSIGGNTLNGLARQDQDNKAYALFGSVNLEVSPQLKLRGGLRYTKDEKDFYADRLIAPPFSPTGAWSFSCDSCLAMLASKSIRRPLRATSALGFFATAVANTVIRVGAEASPSCCRRCKA